MTAKEAAIDVIDALPADASMDDIIHALYLDAKFTRGEQEIRDGKGIPHEQAKERLKTQALQLSPIQRAELIENLLSGFDPTDRDEIDAVWAEEAERRHEAYEKGNVPTISADEVFRKINGDEDDAD